MDNIEGQQIGREREDILQWVADQNRLLKAGLRNKDDEAVFMVINKVEKKVGKEMVERWFVEVVNRMIKHEDFSFID